MARLVKANGYLSLWECVVTLSVLLVLCTFLATPWSWNQAQYEVNVLTRELMLDLQRLREYSMGSSIDGTKIWRLNVYGDSYYLQRSTKIYKEVQFPRHAYVRDNGNFLRTVTFNRDGRPTNTMELVILSRDHKYQRKIILAAQTGRIRVE